MFEREVGRLLFGLLVGLLMVVGSAAYWAVAGPEGILQRDDNPRRVEFERAILRGAIYAADELLLAQSQRRGGRFPVREYLQSAFFGTIGYFSFRYGVGGVEAFYDAQLSGRSEPNTWERWWRESVLGLPRVGADVRLTLEARLQQVASAAFGERRGVVIALGADSGTIRVLLSRPTYDPNLLDEQWAVLSQSPENPFFNRALQGQYQPGSALRLPMALLAALGNVDTSLVLLQADDVVALDEVIVACTLTPPVSDLTLWDALRYGCPQAVVHLVSTFDANAVRTTLQSFELSALPPVDAVPALASAPTAEAATTALLADALGQGQLVVNPLAFARLLAAVVSDGAVPSLRLLDAVRPPNGDWQVQPRLPQVMSLVTSAAAAQGRAWLESTGALLRLPSGTGGFVALAQSGEETQAWFSGFMAHDDETLVVLVILENTADVQAAQTIGEAVLTAYRDASSTP